MSGLVNLSAGGNGEMVMVLEGGDAFAQRVADLKTAKADAETAFAELRLGMEAQAAWDAAHAMKAEYDAKLAAASAEIQALRDATAQDIATERGAAQVDVSAARAEARKIRADAKVAAAKVAEDIAAELEQARLARANADAEFQAAAAQRADAVTAIEHAAAKVIEAEAAKKAADDLVAALKAVMEG